MGVDDDAAIPDSRWREVCLSVGREVVKMQSSPELTTVLAELRSGESQYLDDGLVDVLTEEFRNRQNGARLLANLFEIWRRIPYDGRALVEDVLPRASAAIKRRELDDVEAHLPQGLIRDWNAWLERHPRSSGTRAFGRRGRRSKDDERTG